MDLHNISHLSNRIRRYLKKQKQYQIQYNIKNFKPFLVCIFNKLGIFANTICLISTSALVFDQATNKTILNIETTWHS